MALENAQFIEELNINNPTPEDFRSEGDDHFRMFKAALKNTFPGLGGRAWRVQNRSATGAINLSDNMTLLNAGAITLVPAAASLLGNGFMCFIRANGGNVLVNPAENINGAGQMTVPNGYTGILLCNGSEFFMLLVYQDVPTAVKAFPTGTRMLFNQTAAPTGWTKITSSQYNDAALRMVTGTVGSGGADGFSSTFGTGKTTASHTLTLPQIPAHTHAYTSVYPYAVGVGLAGGSAPIHPQPSTYNSGTAGDGEGHSHNLNNMNIKYADVILASID